MTVLSLKALSLKRTRAALLSMSRASAFLFLHRRLICPVRLSRRLNPAGNQAGMDANIALFAEGFIVYGVFNAVFFLSYYKNVAKVGASFIKSSIAVFVLTALDIASTYAVPFVRSRLDTADPAYLTQKLIFLVTGAVIFAVLNVLTYKISAVNFEKQDLN